MHSSNLVIIEKLEDGISETAITEAVESAMSSGQGDWWDWYAIGGRWTGLFDGYDPEKDPQNIVTCVFCEGTGQRKDMTVESGCNACGGEGKHVTWPTEWKFRAGDIIPVAEMTAEHYEKFHRVVADGSVFHPTRYTPWKENIHEKFQKLEMPPFEWVKKEYAEYLAVVVDCHN